MTLVVFFLVSLIGGVSAPLVKFTVREFPPVILVFVRALLSTLTILPFLIWNKQIFKIAISKNLVAVNFLFAANWIFFAFGIQYTSVIMAQLAYVPTAIIVAVLEYIFIREKLNRQQLLGLILTVSGILILLYGSFKTQDILSFGTPIGNLLVMLGVASWSMYLVFSRKISKIYSPLTITFYNFLASAVIALMLSLFIFSEAIQQIKISESGILGLVVLVLFSSVTIFYLSQWLVKYTTAFVSSLTLYLTAFSASMFGVIFYGEKLTSHLILGAALLTIGVFMATPNKRLLAKTKLN